MKNLSKLNGVKALSKKEQKSINGGWAIECSLSDDSSTDWCCAFPEGGC